MGRWGNDLGGIVDGGRSKFCERGRGYLEAENILRLVICKSLARNLT